MHLRSQSPRGRTSSLGHGDALAVLEREGIRLVQIFEAWDRDGPESQDDNADVAVPAAYDRGNLAKLAIEHGALRVAALRDLAAALRHSGDDDAATRFESTAAGMCDALDCLEEESRGVQPVSLGSSSAVEEYMSSLARHSHCQDDAGAGGLLAEARAALEHSDADLHGDRFLTRHAPVHPEANPSNLARFRPVLWIRARYEHLRGFPWAEDEPFGDPKIDQRYGMGE